MEEIIAEFKKLLEVNERLMGPGGCPWDREQTIVSMRGSLLEEAYEMIDAIDEGDDQNLVEELGDLLYNVLFFCALGEKEKRFETTNVIKAIREKLIHRHPHVFGNKEVNDTQGVIEQWEKIKHAKRESLLDGIPKALPALTKAYKMAGKFKNAHFPSDEVKEGSWESEEELGKKLWELVRVARARGLPPEQALQKHLFALEKEFRAWEKS
jgi:tetrapyrrole methylase family protein/MazG family protein